MIGFMDNETRYLPAAPLTFPLSCKNSAEVAVLLSLHFALKVGSPIPPTVEQMNKAQLHPRTFKRGLNGLIRRGAVVAVKLV
jgi:hypothetical protein